MTKKTFLHLLIEWEHTVLKNTIQGLQKQRDETEKKYNRLQNEYTATVDKLKETEKKLHEIHIKYETEVRDKTETLIEVTSLQKKVISVQEELLNAQKEIINEHKELNNLKEQLHEKADQIGNIQAQLKDNEEKSVKIINTQMINYRHKYMSYVLFIITICSLLWTVHILYI